MPYLSLSPNNFVNIDTSLRKQATGIAMNHANAMIKLRFINIARAGTYLVNRLFGNRSHFPPKAPSSLLPGGIWRTEYNLAALPP
jgi:hypothetical protein